jgi:membrane protease subunit HflK
MGTVFRRFMAMRPCRAHVVLALGMASAGVCVLLASSLYTVEPEEVAVVFRFGRYVRTDVARIGLKAPWPIDAVTRVAVHRQWVRRFGYEELAGPSAHTTRRRRPEEASMLSADLQRVDVQWLVRYRLDEPLTYLRTVRNPQRLLAYLSESTMRSVVAGATLDALLDADSDALGDELLELVQMQCDERALGIALDEVEIEVLRPEATDGARGTP